MRRARFKVAAEEGEAVYHVISRTVNGEWMIDEAAKEVLRRQLWQVAEFAGLEVITYAVLSNHFHILVRVPQKVPISDEELVRRYQVLYPHPKKYQAAPWAAFKTHLASNSAEAIAWRNQLLALMNDVSQYMKLVKERFSIWYNRSHQRFGPVWSDRFKSLLVEPTGRAIEAIAAYIDLNPVRAGIVSDPKDYRFCGYAEAVAGRISAQRGLRSVMGGSSWTDVQTAYRQWLFASGSAAKEGRAVIPAEQVRQVFEHGGKLSLDEILRCRIRYFSDGAVLGSRLFVESQLAVYRRRTGCGQRVSVRTLPELTDWGEITGLRRLPVKFLG